MHTNKVIMFGPAGSVAVSVTPSADLAGDLVDLAGVVTDGVASLPTLLEMLPLVWRPRPLHIG